LDSHNDCPGFAHRFVAHEKKLAEPKANGEQSLGRLAAVIKSAEVANDGFFRSLELVQKNLESLIARAEGMEHRLQSLMLHPGVDKREQYTAAALLLAEGQEAERNRFALTRHLFQYDGRGDRTGNGET
jgi:hypothetical protein